MSGSAGAGAGESAQAMACSTEWNMSASRIAWESQNQHQLISLTRDGSVVAVPLTSGLQQLTVSGLGHSSWEAVVRSLPHQRLSHSAWQKLVLWRWGYFPLAAISQVRHAIAPGRSSTWLPLAVWHEEMGQQE